VAGVVVLYGRFTRRPDAAWREALAIGLTIGLARGVLAPTGWYVVEHTGGPLQVPAYVLAMLAWPEAILLGRHRGTAGPAFLVGLGLLLTATSVIGVSAVALVALTLGRRRRLVTR
jgi:hypothetical protein